MQSGFGEEAGRAAGRASAALGDVGDQQPVLGAGGGDVEQPALLGEPLGVRRGQRPPRGQQLLLAAEQHDRLRLRALGRWIVETVIRRSGSPGVELLGVQARRPARGSRSGSRVVVLLLVGLRGAAQRAEVLEHPFGIAAARRGRGCGRAAAGSGDQPAASITVAITTCPIDRPAASSPRTCSSAAPNSASRVAQRLGADAVESPARARWRRSGHRGDVRAPRRRLR